MDHSTSMTGPIGLEMDGDAPMPINFRDAADERRIGELLGEGGQIRVRVAPADDPDVEGHAAQRLAYAILLPDDDTEGHAITIRFPSAEQAKQFRMRMVATGALVGTLVIGGVAMQATQGLTIGQPDAAAVPQAAADAAGTTTSSEQYQNLYAPIRDEAGTTSPGTQYEQAYTQDGAAPIPADGAGSTSASEQYQDAYVSGADADLGSTSDAAGSTSASEQYRQSYERGAGASADDDQPEPRGVHPR